MARPPAHRRAGLNRMGTARTRPGTPRVTRPRQPVGAGVEENGSGQGRGERSHTGARLVSASRNERQPAPPQHSARTPRSCRPSAQTPCSGVRSRCPFGAVLAVPYARLSHW